MQNLQKVKLFLSLLGIADALYLSYTRITSNPLICKFGDCGSVQASPYALLLGVPVAYLGLVYYFILFLLLFKNSALTKVWIVFGVLFSIYLTFLEIFVIHAICMWCVISFIIIIAIAVMEFIKDTQSK